MKVAIVGSGNIGSNIGLCAAHHGHTVLFSYSRSEEKLAELASKAGPNAGAANVRDAVEQSEVIIFAVPWDNRLDVFPSDLSFDGKIIVDTTNQFSASGLLHFEGSAVSQNFPIFRGAAIAKAFNTLTSRFQRNERDRRGGDRHAMFYAGEDQLALGACEILISAVGFVPVLLGGWDVVKLMEAPRRGGSVYGEAYRPEDAQRIAEAANSNLEHASTLAMEWRLPE